MIVGGVILVSLVAISATVALMLGVAWLDLGRPTHARTWSAAFALLAIIWVLVIVAQLGGMRTAHATVVMPALGGLSSAAFLTGFRQRAGLLERRALLAGMILVYAAILILAAARARSSLWWIAPLCAWNVAMFTLAARTLHGRRQGERSAERVAQAGLAALALVHFLMLGGMAGSAAGLLTLDIGRLGALALVLLPSVVGGIGLFTIILLTADLADRTRRLAATDMLTGLLNRRGFDDAARALFASARRHRRPMALVMIDVDRFKEINDRFGHPAGDRVLCAVCTRLSQGVGRRDVFARVGGEEFALILADVDLQAAACAVEVLRLQVETMTTDLPEPHQVTASFGVAAPEDGDEDFAALLHRADQALYRSKRDGRNRVTIAEPAITG